MNNIRILLQYLRLTSYAIVVLSSLRNINNRKFGKLLFIANIILAISLFISGLYVNLLARDRFMFEAFLLTPAVITWAVLNFYTLILEYKIFKGRK